MKLKYSDHVFAINTVLIYACFVMMLFMIIVCGIILGDAIKSGASTMSMLLMSLGSVLAIAFWLVLIHFIDNSTTYLKAKDGKMGEKVPASIIEARVSPKGNKTHGSLVVSYHCGENRFYVNHVERNDAFELLQLLLNPYPVQEMVSIPIDLYVYKNTIHADLDSVDFSKVAGYEECKRMIEQKYQEQ